MRALADGRVQPEGIDLNFLDLPVEETFFRMLRNREFDVAELSLSSYTRVALSRAAAFRRDSRLPVAHVQALVHLHVDPERHPRAEGPCRQAHRHRRNTR